jgi:transposase
MNTYSVDFRERALATLDRGYTVGEVAEVLGVGPATRKRWRRRRREAGSLAPTPKPGRPPRVAPAQYPARLAQVRAASDATLPEHCAAWERATGERLSPSTMCRLLQRLAWPRKKKG